jgi:hypothetical protein
MIRSSFQEDFRRACPEETVMLHAAASALKYCLAVGSCAVLALCTVYVTRPTAQSNASPIYGVTIPVGYRDWKLIAVAQLVTDKVDQLRAQLGNEIPIREGKSRSRTVQSLPRYIGIAFRRKTTTKSWSVHSPALNLSSSGPP